MLKAVIFHHLTYSRRVRLCMMLKEITPTVLAGIRHGDRVVRSSGDGYVICEVIELGYRCPIERAPRLNNGVLTTFMWDTAEEFAWWARWIGGLQMAKVADFVVKHETSGDRYIGSFNTRKIVSGRPCKSCKGLGFLELKHSDDTPAHKWMRQCALCCGFG